MTKRKKFTEGRALLDLRKICMALPETREVVTFGHPTFQAGRVTYAVFEQYLGDWTVAFKADPDDRELLLQDQRFFVTPYVGKHGWLSLILDDGYDEAELSDLLRRSYRHVALKRMLAAEQSISRTSAR